MDITTSFVVGVVSGVVGSVITVLTLSRFVPKIRISPRISRSTDSRGLHYG